MCGLNTNKRNRYIGLFIVMLLLLSPVKPCDSVSAADPLLISLSSAAVDPGEQNLLIKITVKNVIANLPRGINNSGFTIEYDNRVLQLVSVSRGELIPNPADMAINPGTSEEVNTNPGRIILLHNDDSAGKRPITRDGVYAEFLFKVKGTAVPGTYPLSFRSGKSSLGQMNAAGTYPQNVDMKTVVLENGSIMINNKRTVSDNSQSLANSTHTSINDSTSTQSSYSETKTAEHFDETPLRSATALQSANAVSFTDTSRHWAENYITQLTARGIIHGYQDGSFRPDHPITRAEFAGIISRAMNLPLVNDVEITFGDSSEIGEWAKPSIAALAKKKIIHGYSDGTFRPNMAITRAEMAVITAQAFNLRNDEQAVLPFIDTDRIPYWALRDVIATYIRGIIKGKGDMTFQADAKATRAEVVSIIARALNTN